jgi:transposase
MNLACWAHCRRDFNDALQALPKNARTADQLAAQFIALIGQLYAVEAKARERELDATALLAQRQLHSVPVLQRIEALLLANIHVVLPGSLLGKALHYMSSQWSKLKLYVTSGAYPIDNNACENSISPFVIGRRNWLFADTVGRCQRQRQSVFADADLCCQWCGRLQVSAGIAGCVAQSPDC